MVTTSHGLEAYDLIILALNYITIEKKYNKESDWEQVVKDIKLACIESNFNVNLYGSYKKKRHHDKKEIKIRRFRCCRYEQYQGTKKVNQDPRLQEKGRKRSLISDRRNQRKNGRSLPRLTNTGKADEQCCFGFGAYFDGTGFIILKPGLKWKNHTGHRQKPTNEMIRRKSELSETMEKRIIEDAGVALKISATQRVLNMTNFADGPYIRKSTVQKFRASHVLKSTMDGSIVRIGKEKSDLDLILELLEKNKARIAYISVKSSEELSDKVYPNDNVLIASTPVEDESDSFGTFIAQTDNEKIGIIVEKSVDKYLQVVKIEEYSPLLGLVNEGDKIVSVNGTDIFDISLSSFVEYMQSIKDQTKSIRVWRHSKPNASIPVASQNNATEEKVTCKELCSVAGNQKVFTDAMLEELKKTAKKYRQECLPKNVSYELFLGIAWLLPGNFYACLMFGKTIFIDSTFNVCVFSNFRQMSIVFKNTNGEAFTICRIGIPHERSFLCSWCLEVVVPALMTKLFPKTG